MKYFLTTMLYLLFLTSAFSTQGLAKEKESERSTSLGTGLPTTQEKSYKRESLTPKPTKPPTTSSDFVEEEVDENDESASTDDENNDNTINKDTDTTRETNETDEQHTGTDYFQSKQKTENAAKDEATVTNATAKNQATEQALTTLPQTGIQKNYWGFIGLTIILLGGLVLFFFLRKQPRQK